MADLGLAGAVDATGAASQVIPAVEAERLVKLYGAVPALVEVSLRVEAGAVWALVGPNGAGKTTLLRILATATRPTSGWARIYGADVRHEPDLVRGLADYLPAQGALYPELTVRENLRFTVRMRGLEASEEEVAGALAWAGLEEATETRAATLSSGLARRAGLARLRLCRARLLLVDEPYSAVDEEGQELVDELLLETRADGRAAVVATHMRERIAALADGLLRLERGVEAGDPEPAAVGGTPTYTRLSSSRASSAPFPEGSSSR